MAKFQNRHEEARYWTNRARVDDVNSVVDRFRYKRANGRLLQALLADNPEQTGYHGTTTRYAKTIAESGFSTAYHTAESVYVWPAKVAFEALRDTWNQARVHNLERPEDVTVLQVSMTNPEPDTDGNLRWLADPATTRVTASFSQREFIDHVILSAMEDPEAYDIRHPLDLR